MIQFLESILDCLTSCQWACHFGSRVTFFGGDRFPRCSPRSRKSAAGTHLAAARRPTRHFWQCKQQYTIDSNYRANCAESVCWPRDEGRSCPFPAFAFCSASSLIGFQKHNAVEQIANLLGRLATRRLIDTTPLGLRC
jgi:hypothetical protein